ncbi:hypothetical protein T02_3220 [Trichinella nativa]|uniref:Uncharacterized protein n=1 Tax=Trichinella nativa TaxID=6335 RepID=A0A0V1KUW7_9BILA|nr:hypothetical protein T02_3220 [Trichinella nativa]
MFKLRMKKTLLHKKNAGVNCYGSYISMTIWRDLLAYSRIFDVLHYKAEELGLQLNPAKFVCDFETALIPAI